MNCAVNEPVLQLDRVRKDYGLRTVLRDVSLAVVPGVTLLTGANGAGKSTLLRLMAGLETPTEGTVHLAETPAYVGHATFLYAGLTALENLAFWDKLYGGACPKDRLYDDRLMDVLDRVELSRFAEERAGTFSRGMAQRLNLARVLLQKSRLLLLDEPDTGLDTQSEALLLREIVRAREGGAAVVWISHHVAAHAEIADAVWRIEHGEVRCEVKGAGVMEKTRDGDSAC